MFGEETGPKVTKKAAIYARVSTTEQAEEGYSIDEQTQLLRDWCIRNDYEVYEEYVDRGISGKSIHNRPALKQLLEDSQQKKFDMVIVWKTNRLARTTLDLLKIVELLDRNNIAFKSYSENHETETPQGKLTFQMMAAIAEFERNNIAENVKMGMVARAKEGSWNGGRVLGYDSVKVGGEDRKRKITRLVINQKEAQTVRRIFQLYIEGNGYKSIANQLNKEGYRTKMNNHFSINAVRTILTNPVYEGYIRYDVRRNWTEKRRNDINSNPIIQKGHHEPIITEDTWKKAQAIFQSRSKKPNRVHSGDFPLTGIMKCPACGAGMVLGRTTNRNKDGTKRILEYYVCGAWKNKGTAVCRSNGVRVDYADEYVLNKVAEFATNKRLIKDIVDKINHNHKSVSDPLLKEKAAIKSEIHAIQGKKDKVLGLYEEGILSKTDLAERLSKLNDERQLLDERMSSVSQQLGLSGKSEISFDMVQEVMSKFVKSYKHSLTTEQRKRLLQLLIKSITISEDKKIESIEIQFNNAVLDHFTNEEEEELSGEDDFSSSFLFYIAI